METPIPRNCYAPSLKVLSPRGEQPAQQQFKNDCDINTIMKRIQKDEALNHVQKHQLEYGVTTPTSYHQSLNIIKAADSMFADLPSQIRNEFNNNPQAFLKFVQDPKNQDRAYELGIALSTKAAEAAEPPGAAKTPDDEGAKSEGTDKPPVDKPPPQNIPKP